MKINFDIMLEAAIPGKTLSSIPLYEHFVDDQIIEVIMDYDFSKVSGQEDLWKKKIEFYKQTGYTYLPVEFDPKFAATNSIASEDTAIYSKGKRGWADEHNGAIKTIKDVEDPSNWPQGDAAFDYDRFDMIAGLLPEGMKIIGGASGGPFEHASFLMGLENLCIALYEDPEMIELLFEKIGNSLIEIAKRLVKHEKIGIYRFGDDLGFKNGTMISPVMLRKYVFPWQKKVVEEAHKAEKLFLLHSCGQLKDVMDDLIDDVKIDIKHSFEDVIMPVPEAKRLWGGRIALFGGLDVDFLCQHSPEEVREYTKKILDACAKDGGYAAGTGNTVTNYMPVKNYLAMLDTVREFNG